MAGHYRRRPAFALWDLAAAAVVLGVAVALLTVVSRENRRLGRLGECLGNLKQYGFSGGAFAADNTDLVWTFTWRAGTSPSQYPDLRFAGDDLQAASNQAVDILRRRGGRVDIPMISSWVPHLLYSHLMLADYLGSGLPSAMVTCPEDKLRLQWAADPHGYDTCRYNPNPGCGDSNSARWPYSSTYEMQPSFYSPDAVVGSAGTVYQGPVHYQYFIGSNVHFGGRLMAEVRYPSQKAMVYEQHDRHHLPRTPFFAFEEARGSILAADGSAAVRLTAETNTGWNPSTPTLPFPTTITYMPAAWEPPTLTGGPSQTATGHYRWTRRGLAGRDFGGAQVP